MKQPPLFGWQRTWRLIAAAVVGSAFAYLIFLPEKEAAGIPGSFCLFHKLTGLPCALCGGTRSTQALLHGNFERAWDLNAASFPAVIGLTVLAAILLTEAIRGRAWANWRELSYRYRVLFPLALALLILWWIPQMAGAIAGTKGELIDRKNPVARWVVEYFGTARP